MDFINEIVSRFPIRKRPEQKQAFRDWALQQAAALGYSARVEALGRKQDQQNIVIGSPAEAQVIFTAHYDTPARGFLPNLMIPRNVPLFILYQMAVVGVLLVISFALAIGAGLLTRQPAVAGAVWYVVYFGLLFMMLMGPANKNNVNDNTSGVASVFALMERLPAEVRDRAAFILFDNEEKGLLGSKAYAKEHPK